MRKRRRRERGSEKGKRREGCEGRVGGGGEEGPLRDATNEELRVQFAARGEQARLMTA